MVYKGMQPYGVWIIALKKQTCIGHGLRACNLATFGSYGVYLIFKTRFISSERTTKKS